MIGAYFPYFVLIVLAVGLAGVLSAIAIFLGPKRRNFAKSQPFETGLEYIPTKKTVHVGFYRVAMVFLLFDVEVVMLYPYVYKVKDWGAKGLMVVFFFLSLMILGIAYEWGKKLVKW